MAASVLIEPTVSRPVRHLKPSARSTTGSVLHVINGEHYSGAERVQDLLAGRLPECGFQVGLACVKPDKFPELRQTRSAPLYEVPMRGRFDLRPVWRLVRIIRREGYDLVHAHTPRTVLLAALASLICGVPLVYHFHSPTSRDSTRRWQNTINALIERISLIWASGLIAVSHSLGRHVRRQGFSARAVSVVPNGVPRRRPRAVRPASQSDWTLGTVALFRPRKGLEVLLEALAILKGQGLPVRLRAVGTFETPEYEREIKDQARRLGVLQDIQWTGFTRDVDGQLAQMDIFVLPSLFGEGLPMVVLEAMAAGVPVVATRVEGTPEAIRDGRDGLIAEPSDPHDLARVIARVISGQFSWHALRESALERHAESFSDRSMAAGVAEVYRRVLA